MPLTISTPYRSANSFCAASNVSMLMMVGCVPSMKYGADKLSAVKEEDYPRLMADLEAIV